MTRRKRIVETTGVEVGSTVRPMPAAPSYGPFAPSFANPPPLSAFYGVDEDRGISRELEEAAKLGDSIGRALRAAVGLAVIVADVINEADQKPARVRRVRK